MQRIPYETFANALKSAIYPFEESDEVVQKIENSEDSALEIALPKSLLTDDLLKKSGVGQQFAKTTVSMREVLGTSERIESMGYIIFDTLAKQELTLSPLWADMAARRHGSLMKILQLRDDLDFHRLRLP